MKRFDLPEDVRNDARSRRGHRDPHDWSDADFVASVVAECTHARGDRSRAINILAADMGITRSEAVDLCLMGETYPPAVILRNKKGEAIGIEPGIREQYAGILTTGHYREAMHSETQTKPAQWLQLAVDSADDFGGMPMPVTVLRSKVRAANAEAKDKPSKNETYRASIDKAFKALGDALGAAPDDHKKSIASMRQWLAKVMA